MKRLLYITIFLAIVGSITAQTEDQKAFPCRYGDEYKKLDFWLGEWDVYVKDKKTATSSITKSEGGCTLHEDYKTLTNFFGRSINYYDPKDEKYTQIWIDKFNGITTFKEVEARKGYLKMTTDDGNGTLTNMDYTLDETVGHVTQTMESSKDGGKTWKRSFKGVYKPRNEGQ
ncbi:MAG: hypothetical protein P1U56_13620 [Saprospiraceae bacterium]|nr:hypothetical protein [Saprospiraceae bacterium]